MVKGRFFSSDTLAIINENSDWEVTVRMTERRLRDGMDWEEKILSTKCTEDSFEKAYGIAMRATLEKFNAVMEETKSDSMFPLLEEEIVKE